MSRTGRFQRRVPTSSITREGSPVRPRLSVPTHLGFLRPARLNWLAAGHCTFPVAKLMLITSPLKKERPGCVPQIGGCSLHRWPRSSPATIRLGSSTLGLMYHFLKPEIFNRSTNILRHQLFVLPREMQTRLAGVMIASVHVHHALVEVESGQTSFDPGAAVTRSSGR